MNRKGRGMKLSWPPLSHFISICLEKLRKIKEVFSLEWYSDTRPPE